MATSRLRSLPRKFHTGLSLLERGYALANGGRMPPVNLHEKVLDLINRSHQLFEEALDRKVVIEGVKVPPLESLLALKYLSSSSPWQSREDRGQDVIDFIKSYKDNRARINRKLLVEIASRAHEKAPEEFPEFLDAVEKDRPITL